MKRTVLIAVFAATIHTSHAATDAQLRAEIDRVEASLQRSEDARLDKDFADLLQPYRDRLAKARAASSPLVRLYRLRDAYIGAETLAFIARHRSSGNELETFREFWKTSRPRFEKTTTMKRGPFLEVALRQAAANRAGKLFHASLLYGKVSSPLYGLYYLAEAEGNLRFRDFVDSVMSPAVDRAAPESAELEAAYKGLQTETLKFFAADPAGRGSIGVSVRLKEARELLDQKLNEAATLSLLETRLTLSRQQKNTAEPPGLEKQTADSLSALWQDMAREEDAETARFIRRDVLPLYASLKLPAPALARPTGPTTVTLVRWPYT